MVDQPTGQQLGVDVGVGDEQAMRPDLHPEPTVGVAPVVRDVGEPEGRPQLVDDQAGRHRDVRLLHQVAESAHPVRNARTRLAHSPTVEHSAYFVHQELDSVVASAPACTGRWKTNQSTRDRADQAMKALLLENIHPEAERLLSERGIEVSTVKGALDEAELVAALDGVHLLGIRSKTNVTAKVLETARTCWRSARSASAPTRSTWPRRRSRARRCSTRRSPTPAASSSW